MAARRSGDLQQILLMPLMAQCVASETAALGDEAAP
jgi:hypothetical protein